MTDTPTTATLTIEAHTRQVVDKIVVIARVTNNTDTELEVTISSSYGSKKVTLAAGRSTSASFSTRLSSIEAGEVIATANGETVRTSYDAR